MGECVTDSETPTTYLSHNGGRWRVIHGGCPLCRDTDESTARRVERLRRWILRAESTWLDRGQARTLGGLLRQAGEASA